MTDMFRLLPRTFRNRMTLLFGLLSLLVGIPTYFYVSSVYRDQLITDRYDGLQALATSAATVIAENLVERRREIDLLARTPLFRQAPLNSPELRASLERLKQSYPHYSWIGFADKDGMVRAATAGHLTGQDVGKRPWFQHGRNGIYVGDLHEALLLAKLLEKESSDQVMRFIDFASPVLDDAGNLRGVLGAHTHWRWAGDVLDVVTPKNADELALDIFIVNQRNEIIYPEQGQSNLKAPDSEALRGRSKEYFHAWGGDKQFMTAAASIKDPVSANPLRWRVVVRQPKSVVLANVSGLQAALLTTSIGAMVVFVLLAWAGADRMSRPVEHLTDIAHRIERGEEKVQFDVQANSLELRRLSAALGGMATTLVERKNALEASNRDLEAKVAERTAELMRLNQELDKLARNDILTGLPNRLCSNERLAEEFARLKRGGATYTVLILDIDYFKRVNDTHGHATGDAVLRHVSALVRQALRITDFVGRVGGEEFMLILPMTSLDQGLPVAEKVRAAIEAAPMEPVGRMTVSIGAQEASGSDANEDVAVQLADEWLYKAKKSGRNRVASLRSA